MEPTKQEKVFQKVVEEAWSNPEFKAQLIQNPIATIESFSGETMNIPEGKNFKVIDQTDDATIYFNLPAKQNNEDVELNEDQLDMVSGGGGIQEPSMGLVQEISYNINNASTANLFGNS